MMDGTATAYSLTAQERRLVVALQDFLDSGVSPSFEQLAGFVGVNKSSVHRLVTQLQRKGWIRRLPHAARSIALIHRLAPAPGQAMAQLLTALLQAKPSEGFVHISLPLELIDQAALACGMKREA
jgi:DNA-binding MarR family transcriptional regulator